MIVILDYARYPQGMKQDGSGPTAGTSPRRRLDVVALTTLAIVALRCGSGEGTPSVSGDEARALLRSVVTRVVEPTHLRCLEEARELERLADVHRREPTPAHLDRVREAWRSTAREWQHAELLQLGPSASVARPGGLGIRDEIYSWPTSNRCRVDDALIEHAYEDPAAFADEIVIVRGLDAMEHLLFNEDTGNACHPAHPINESGAWPALSPDALATRRASYAATLATLVREEVEGLARAWDAPDEGFSTALMTAGHGSPVFDTPDEALDELLVAMFYLDVVVRELKLALPLGFGVCRRGCSGQVESHASHASIAHVASNLRAFRWLFLGSREREPAVGFDDLLIWVGEAELATRMVRQIDEALALAESVEQPLPAVIEAEPERAFELHQAVTRIVEDLRGPLVTALRLSVPSGVGGETD